MFFKLIGRATAFLVICFMFSMANAQIFPPTSFSSYDGNYTIDVPNFIEGVPTTVKTYFNNQFVSTEYHVGGQLRFTRQPNGVYTYVFEEDLFLGPGSLFDLGSTTVTVTLPPPEPPVISGVTVNGSPVNGTIDVVAGSLVFNVQATDPEGGTLSYFWNFGVGTCLGCATKTATPLLLIPEGQDSAVFNASVTISDNTGLTDTEFFSVIVTRPPPLFPAVEFTSDDGNYTIQVPNFIEGVPTTVKTYFNNQFVSTEYHPGGELSFTDQPNGIHIHVFEEDLFLGPGSLHDLGSATVTVELSPRPPKIQTFTANGREFPELLTIRSGTALDFAASATDANGGELTYSWDFGGAEFCSICAPGNVAFFNTPDGQEAAVFNVSVTVTDDTGLSDTRTAMIRVEGELNPRVVGDTYSINLPALGAGSTFTISEFINGQFVSNSNVQGNVFTLNNRTPGLYEYQITNNFDPRYVDKEAFLVVPQLSEGVQKQEEIVNPNSSLKYPISIDVDIRSRLSVDTPIDVPAGVNGVQPTLSLSYRSPRSDAVLDNASILYDRNRFETPSVLSHGWNLTGLSIIGLCATDINAFCLNGEPLFREGSFDSRSAMIGPGQTFRPATTPDARVTVKGGSNGNWFEVQQSGMTMRFGKTPSTRATRNGQVVFWYMEELVDEFGNVMSVDYGKDSQSSLLYPLSFAYGSNRVELAYAQRAIETPLGTNQPSLLPPSNFPAIGASVTKAEATAFVQEYSSYINATRPELRNDQFHLAPLRLHTIKTYSSNKPVKEFRLQSDFVDGYERLSKVQVCGFDSFGANPQCSQAMNFSWREMAPFADAVIPRSEVNQYAIGLQSITDSLGQRTDVSYNPIEFQLPTSLTDWYQRAFDEVFTVTGALALYDTWTVSGLTQQISGASTPARTFYQRSSLGVKGDVQSTVLPNGNVVYRAYLKAASAGFFEERLILEETYAGSFGSGRLLTSREQDWDFKQGDAGHRFNYVQSERNYLIEDSGSRIGGSFTETTVNWDAARGIANTIHKKTTTGYGALSIGDPNLVFDKSVESIIEFDNIIDSSRWLVGFPRTEQTIHCQRSDCSDARRLRNTNTPLVGRDSFKKGSTTLAANFTGTWEDKVTVQNQYDNFGNLISTTTSGADFDPRTQTFGNYIDNRFVGTITQPLSDTVTSITEMDYNRQLGLPTRVTDANNNLSVTSQYDNFGRVIRTTAADGTEATTRYEACDNSCGSVEGVVLITRVITEARNGFTQVSPTSTSYQDSLGRTVRVEVEGFNPGEIITVDTVFDEVGRVAKISLPYSNFSTEPVRYVENFYDEQNRLIARYNPDGSHTTIDYEQMNGSVQVTTTETATTANVADKVQKRREIFNSLGQLVETIDAFDSEDAVSTTYAYDQLGNNTFVRINGNDDTDVITQFDFAGNPTQITDPSTGTTFFRFDALGQLKSQTDARGVVTDFNYDLAGRLTRRIDDVHGVVGSPTFNTFVFDTRKIGQLTSRTGSGLSENYQYDNLLRLIQTDTSLTADGSTRNFSSLTTYDAQGRQATQSFPSGLTVRTRYNALGFADALLDNATGNVLSETVSTDAFGNVTQTNLGNGLTSTRNFDPLTGLLTNINTGNGEIQDQSYRWYSDGTLYQRSERARTNVTETFSYDNLNRLIQASTGVRTLSYDHDALGNLLYQRDSSANGHNVEPYVYDSRKPHQLKRATINGTLHYYTYDAVGNLVVDNAKSSPDDRTITFGALGKPTEIIHGSTSNPNGRDEFIYGPNSARFYKESLNRSSGTAVVDRTFYLYGGTYEVVLPGDGNLQEIQKTSLGDVLHVRELTLANASERFEYLHTDHLGSVEAITNENGDLLSGQQFDPYGLRRSGSFEALATVGEIPTLDFQNRHTTRGFTGQEQLDGTGLVHMNGRVYDPRLGRFISADPFVQFPTVSQSYNRYAYVRNNPLSVNDPTGFREPPPLPSPGALDGKSVPVLAESGASGAGGFLGRGALLQQVFIAVDAMGELDRGGFTFATVFASTTIELPGANPFERDRSGDVLVADNGGGIFGTTTQIVNGERRVISVEGATNIGVFGEIEASTMNCSFVNKCVEAFEQIRKEQIPAKPPTKVRDGTKPFSFKKTDPKKAGVLAAQRATESRICRVLNREACNGDGADKAFIPIPAKTGNEVSNND